jgi:hypothetical protein
MVDWPECEPCVWRIDGSAWGAATVSDALVEDIRQWAIEYLEQYEANDDHWTGEAVRARWLQEGWRLLGQVNLELLPRGFVVRPADEFLSLPTWARTTDSASVDADLPTEQVTAILDQINEELRRRGLPGLEIS